MKDLSGGVLPARIIFFLRLPASCGRRGRIVRSSGLNRAVVEAQSCGRCGPIERSLQPDCAVPARREAAQEGLCKAFGLLKKRFGLFIKTPKHFDQKPETFFRALYGRETVAVDLPVQVERIDIRHA